MYILPNIREETEKRIELLKKAKKILEMFFSYFDLEYKIGQNELKCIADFLKTSDDVEKKVKEITRDLFRKNISCNLGILKNNILLFAKICL
jgi:hypothetical protein